MGTSSHQLIDGERIRRESPHVNARLPGIHGTKSGTLFLTDTRLIFRSKILFKETVYDVPLDRIVDATAQSNGIGPGLLVITTAAGEKLRLRVKYNEASGIASDIHRLQQPRPARRPAADPWDDAPTR